MAILNIQVDTDQIFDGDEYRSPVSFESLIQKGLRDAVVKDMEGRLAGDDFKQFAEKTADAVESQIKVKMEGFLEEEIVVTGKWGETNFVGSVEDLIKSRFDSVLLKPVDSGGRTVQGCTSSGQTWLEWMLTKQVDEKVKSIIEVASKKINEAVLGEVNRKLVEIKDAAIKSQVDAAFVSILKK